MEIRTQKVLVPKSRIPPCHPMCMKCNGPMRAVFGTAHAAGYHRRHVCCDPGCGSSVYTLAEYESAKVHYSYKPFKDRALTELELIKRDEWWEQDANYAIIAALTPAAALDIPARIREALDKKENERTNVDKYLLMKHQEIMDHLKLTMSMEIMDE